MKKTLLIILLLFSQTQLIAGFKKKKQEPDVDPYVKAYEAGLKGLDFLADSQRAGGDIDYWDHVNSLTGIAWTLSGSTPFEGKYKDNINKLTNYLINRATLDPKKRKEGQMGGWMIGFNLQYLAQVASLGDYVKVEKKVNEIIKTCQLSQYPGGGWTHDVMHKNKLGYDHLVAVSVVITNGLGMARQAGFKVPQDMMDKAIKYIKDSSVGGQVGYSPRAGQRGIPRAGGRWAGTYSTMLRFGLKEDNFFNMLKENNQYIVDAGDAHASGGWHYLTVGMAAGFIGGTFQEKFYNAHTKRAVAKQNKDGSFMDLKRLGSEHKKDKAMFNNVVCTLICLHTKPSNTIYDNFDAMDLEHGISLNKLIFIQNMLGKDCPENLKKLITASEAITGKEKDIKKKFEKLYKASLLEIVLKINALEDKKMSHTVIKKLIGFQIGKVEITKRRSVSPSWDIKGVMMPLFLGKADGTIAMSFDSQTTFKVAKPLRLTSLRTSEKKFKKSVFIASKQKFSRGAVTITVTAKWGEIELTDEKKVNLP